MTQDPAELSGADLRKYDEDRITREREFIERMQRPATRTVWYWVREFSESLEFPEVHIFDTEDEARRTMIAEALEAAALTRGQVTDEMDGPAITHCLAMGWGSFHERVTSLNVQFGDDGAVDCFRLMSQEV